MMHQSPSDDVWAIGAAYEPYMGRWSRQVAREFLAWLTVPHPDLAVSEMQRVVRPGGIVAAYVWDHADQMQFTRYFWNAAVKLDPAAFELDEGQRFQICKPESLTNVFHTAKLNNIEVRAIDVPTAFSDFDDYWRPFLGGQGPAPTYVMSLSEDRRTALREEIRANLPIATDGSIHLITRAWAIRGVLSH
jgi:hypothetical protein